MNIVAREAGDASAVHYALNEVIALHAILVGGAIGEMREGHLTEGVVFELPKIAEVESDAIADRPRNTSLRWDSSKGVLVNGTGCKRHWLPRSPSARD